MTTMHSNAFNSDTPAQRAGAIDEIAVEKTPLYIGPGVVLEGHISFKTKTPDQRAIVLGTVHGNISMNATLQVAEGGVVVATDSIDCHEIIVAGTITGKGVKISASLLVVTGTGKIDVDVVSVPSGCLVQERGSSIKARLEPLETEVRAEALVSKPTAGVVPVPIPATPQSAFAPIPTVTAIAPAPAVTAFSAAPSHGLQKPDVKLDGVPTLNIPHPLAAVPEAVASHHATTTVFGAPPKPALASVA